VLGNANSENSSSKTEQYPLVISEVMDKVVQDVTGEESTGVWSNTEAIDLHVPAFTLNIAHAFRLTLMFRGNRERASNVLEGGFPPSGPQHQSQGGIHQSSSQSRLRSLPASFIQGFNVIAKADQQQKWNIEPAQVWQIWRAGCIIQADCISDEILAPILKSNTSSSDPNLNFLPHVANDIHNCFPVLRQVAAKSVETDQVTPAISATLEHLKIISGTDLPKCFYEAELDYFGNHMFDNCGDTDENVRKPMERKHPFEWKPATSQREEYCRNY
jgi:6-phosphogluconate dehydrogenase